eukprot:853043-Rhodomonas_salina.1
MDYPTPSQPPVSQTGVNILQTCTTAHLHQFPPYPPRRSDTADRILGEFSDFGENNTRPTWMEARPAPRRPRASAGSDSPMSLLASALLSYPEPLPALALPPSTASQSASAHPQSKAVNHKLSAVCTSNA